MELPSNLAGKPISLEQAEKYVNEYLPLKECLKEKVLPKITSDELTIQNIRETNTYFKSDVNAFFFSKETILRFFEPKEPNDPKAEYLVVMLGAKYEDNADKGNPTVVVAGVNNHPSKSNTYVSLAIASPATEQPPTDTKLKFPGPKSIDGDVLDVLEITIVQI